MSFLENLKYIKALLVQKKAELQQSESDLKNINKIALDQLDPALKLKIDKLETKLEKDKQQLDIANRELDSVQSQIEINKQRVKEFGKGASVSYSKELKKYRTEVSNLKTAIEATNKILEKLNTEKSIKLKPLIKELSSQKRKMIEDIKKDLKFLEQEVKELEQKDDYKIVF